jgi:limonene-1,2-epoxide hydrolase
MHVVERFLAAMVAHDWDAMAACVADDIVRVGPYGDEYRGRAEYVKFISELLPTLAGYSMRVDRITPVGDGARVLTELSETVELDGSPIETPEALLFEIDGDMITSIDIYMKVRR